MIYTVRFAHLEKQPGFIVGDEIKRGNHIGQMGNSGASRGAHLHIDCVLGQQQKCWRLSDMAELAMVPAFKQLNYFLDKELFNTELEITTHFNDPEYYGSDGRPKTHLAYDVVPKNRHQTTAFFTIIWNRSMKGQVTGVGYDEGYGNYLLISFEA